MPIPCARSADEAWLYVDLHGCACGEYDFEPGTIALVNHPGHWGVNRYEITCVGCRSLRSFMFAIADHTRYRAAMAAGAFGGPEPSELIDAGEWFLLGCRTAQRGEGPDGALMIDEVAKFIAAGDEAPSDAAFDSVDGQRIRDAVPGAFRRDALVDRARRYRAGRLVGDEQRVPGLRRDYPDNRARNRLTDALKERIGRGAETLDFATLLAPEVTLELDALFGPGTGWDQYAVMLAAALRWARYQASPPGPGRRAELAEAVRLYDSLRGVADDWPVPDEVADLLRQLDGP